MMGRMGLETKRGPLREERAMGLDSWVLGIKEAGQLDS